MEEFWRKERNIRDCIITVNYNYNKDEFWDCTKMKCWRRHRNIWRCIVNATGDLPMASIPRISSLPPSKKLWNESDKDLKSEEKFFALIELLLDLIEAIG